MRDIPAGNENLERVDFKYFTVNHTKNFVDLEKGTQTQKIESAWNVLKRRN